ncbi:PAS domain S-box protein [Dictyocaulus viviparus]|uniref:PAS domain S-box protein n=1 Tax=Dictyocaulus viviparus TaxID=29172 RepID=A0A0D8XFF0_DICVI|nr:PAS domain S-box protein [Dictyocaulus viviparus]
MAKKNFRNIEKRRETSRYAARDRRGKETEIFSDLRAVVPIVDEGTVTHLDRIAVLRVSSAWCRIRRTAPNVIRPSILGPELTKTGRDLWCEDTITEALDGFIIIADSDGTVLCVTESVCLYLGLSQTDLVGRSLKEFMHPTDYTEYMELTNNLASVLIERQDISKSPECGQYVELRMKTVITQRGRNLNLKSALYKSISFILRAERSLNGYVIRLLAASEPAGQGSANVQATALTKFADTPTGSFITRHTSDMRISYVHDRLNYILKNELKSLMGTSFFELIEPNDLPSFRESMKTLFAKGHVRTAFYRLLAANNTVVWVTTEASTMNHTSKGQRAQYVICVHHIAGIKGMSDEGNSSKTTYCNTAQVKKEIDDMRDYAGRQPHVDATGTMDFQMQPLTGREDFSMMTRLLSFVDTDKIKRTSMNGAGEKSSQTHTNTFFRGQSQCATQCFEQENNSTTGISSVATAQIMVAPSRSQSHGSSSSSRCGRIKATDREPSSSQLAENIAQCEFYDSPWSTQSNLGGRIDGFVGGDQPSARSRSFPAVCPSDNISLSSQQSSTGKCDDNSSLLSSLSAAITTSTTGSLPTMTDYPLVAPQIAPTFEDIPFEEPNIDNSAIRAPYISQPACDNGITTVDDLPLDVDDIGLIDLSNEDFNSMFEQVISQSRPSAGRAVLRHLPPNSHMQHYCATDHGVDSLPASTSYSHISPPLKRSFPDNLYNDFEVKSLSMNSGVNCSSSLFWPGETLLSDQERMFYQQGVVYRQV